MARKSTHKIKNMIIEVEYDTPVDLPAFTDRTRKLFYEHLLPMLERILDEMDVEDRVIRLDTLELDLGAIPEQDFPRLFTEQGQQQLRSELRRQVERALYSTHPELSAGHAWNQDVRQNGQEYLMHALVYGMAPWWARKDSQYALVPQFEDWFRTAPQRLELFLRTTGNYDTVRIRILQQIPAALLRSFLESLQEDGLRAQFLHALAWCLAVQPQFSENVRELISAFTPTHRSLLADMPATDRWWESTLQHLPAATRRSLLERLAPAAAPWLNPVLDTQAVLPFSWLQSLRPLLKTSAQEAGMIWQEVLRTAFFENTSAAPALWQQWSERVSHAPAQPLTLALLHLILRGHTRLSSARHPQAPAAPAAVWEGHARTWAAAAGLLPGTSAPEPAALTLLRETGLSLPESASSAEIQAGSPQPPTPRLSAAARANLERLLALVQELLARITAGESWEQVQEDEAVQQELNRFPQAMSSSEAQQFFHWFARAVRSELSTVSASAQPQTPFPATSAGDSPDAQSGGIDPVTGTPESPATPERLDMHSDALAAAQSREAEAAEAARRAIAAAEAEAERLRQQSREMLEALKKAWKRPRPQWETEPETEYYIDHAGLVLLWPFLGAYLEFCGVMGPEGFLSDAARHRAAGLLYYLITGEAEPPEEANLVLFKIFCGIPPEEPVITLYDITEAEKREGEEMLGAVVLYWKALGNSSPEALRGTYLNREGVVRRKDGGWRVEVSRKSWDILLKSLPWGIGTIRLSWLNEFIYVEW